MNEIVSSKPLLAVGVSLLAAALISLSGKKPNLRETWTFLAAFIKCGLVFSMLPAVLDGTTFESYPLEILPGWSLHFRADAFGMVFALLSSSLWVLTSVYSVRYMRETSQGHQTTYFSCFAICISASIGIAFAIMPSQRGLRRGWH